MNDQQIVLPKNYTAIKEESEKINFNMSSDLQTGSILSTLVTSKPNGKFLELGTGTGLSLAWIVDAMDENSKVISIDTNEAYQVIAKKHFDADDRVIIMCEDGITWIKNNQQEKFDLIFADAWPGKYEAFEETLALVKRGGFYIIDDMLPQPNWPAGHEENVERLISELEAKKGIRLTKMNWSTGLIIVAKIN
ncbi:methyltransferase domain-containing protein [Panacibacter ginsenosidivorans]|uniref:Methyltransferase domain-containing protein n=1 Tax=Panacibacter ginsenosidivorans TaxID=1813871 RepID=A0A5B8V9V6_9BACT|nr:class I SAM-dependent methyltransferase [Panacibacter ginsenosidivorans]QEC67108.1 methyltransferase domain-containing protein [Panacibacter ginsenosidivorans]